MAFAIISDRDSTAYAEDVIQPETSTTQTLDKQEFPSTDPSEIHAPYDDYILTQGLHGESYGHLAVDLTAGKGTVILSPITGEITALFIDKYGNTTLVVENDAWQVTLLHGDYTVSIGDKIEISQPIGFESNHGYTVDWQGQSCLDRDCGYHTHLNIFNKSSSKNANPLEILTPSFKK